MESVYSYIDFRAYLADYYASQKRRDPSFSYRRLADRAGFRTKDFIYRVIEGQKNLSSSSVDKISTALGHSRHETEYFCALVRFNQAKSHGERDRAYGRMVTATRRARGAACTAVVSHRQYELFSTWYHLVVRSLIDLFEFRGDYKALARRVFPAITPSQARRSVELLVDLGLVARDESGVYRVVDKAITTGETVRRHALHTFYLESMKLAAEAMDRVPRSQRNITGLTLGISKRSYGLIVERLSALRKEIAEIANRDEEADRVYGLDLLLFPLSKTGKERAGQ
jgi:uncharacterized protein (TIGR02147 family)